LSEDKRRGCKPGYVRVGGKCLKGTKIRDIPKKKAQNRLVVADAGWAESIPDWVKKEIEWERTIKGLAAIIENKGEGPETVGDAELLAYLMTASLAGPPPHNVAQIQLYLGTKVCDRSERPIPDDIRVTELTPDQENELKSLRREIWKARGGRISDPLLDVMRNISREGEKRKKFK